MASLKIGNVAFTHALEADALGEALSSIKAAQAKTKAASQKLASSVATKNEAAQTATRNWLLYSSDAILTSAIAANAKLRPEKRKSLECVLEVPAKLNFAKPIPEIVPVHPKLKKPITPGEVLSFRALHDHGLLHRTAQNAIQRVLAPYFVPRAFQFTHLGTQAAIKQSKKLIKAGYTYSARLDIVDFYKSFSASALIELLPLSKEVVEHAVIGRYLKVIVAKGMSTGTHSAYFSSHDIEHLLIQARRGVPLGSASSPIVGMICISHLKCLAMEDADLLNYADDFMLFAKSADALEKSIGVLTEAVSGLPGGEFKLATKSKGSVLTGIDFLGHRLHLTNGQLKTTPTPANLEYIHCKLNDLDEKIGVYCWDIEKKDPKEALKLLIKQYALAVGWASAFSECDDSAKEWVDVFMFNIADWAAKIGVSFAQLGQSVEPWMGYKPRDYALGL